MIRTAVGVGDNARMSLTERLLLSWVSNAIMLAVADLVLTNVTVRNVGDLILAAALFGISNTFLKPIVRLLTLPLAVITLGVAWFFVSMLMLWLTQSIVSGSHHPWLLDTRLGNADCLGGRHDPRHPASTSGAVPDHRLNATDGTIASQRHLLR